MRNILYIAFLACFFISLEARRLDDSDLEDLPPPPPPPGPPGFFYPFGPPPPPHYWRLPGTPPRGQRPCQTTTEEKAPEVEGEVEEEHHEDAPPVEVELPDIQIPQGDGNQVQEEFPLEPPQSE